MGTTITSSSNYNISHSGHNPPHQNSHGNWFQIVVYDAGSYSDELACFGSVSGTSAWTEIDSGDRPRLDTDPSPYEVYESITSFIDSSDRIHIAGVLGANIVYAQFDASNATYTSNAWANVGTGIGGNNIQRMSSGTPLFGDYGYVSIAGLRSSGDPLVVVAPGNGESIKGKQYERVEYYTRSSAAATGTWSGPTNADGLTASTTTTAFGALAVKHHDSDLIHIGWGENPTDDSWTNLYSYSVAYGRTLNGSTLQTKVLLASLGSYWSDSNVNGMQRALSYDDGGTEELLFCGGNSDADIILVNTPLDGSDYMTTTSVHRAYAPSEDVGSDAAWDMRIIDFAVDGTTIYAVYGAGTAGGNDLFYRSTSDEGATWSASTEVEDAVTADQVNCEIYGTTLAISWYDNSATITYSEVDLGGGGSLVARPAGQWFAKLMRH